MSKRDIEAGRAHVALYVKNSAMVKGLQAAQKRLTSFGQSITKIGAGITGAGVAMLAPLTAALTQFTTTGATFSKIASQTGSSVESVSKLAGAAGEFGIEIDDVVGSMEELNIRLGEAVQDGTGPLADMFKKLGIDAKEFSELPVDEQYKKLADVLAGIENRSERQFVADEILGGDAFKIMPLLEQGGAKLADQLERISGMSAEEAKQAAALSKLWNQLTATFNRAVTAIGGALAPAMNVILKIVKEITAPVVEWIRANQKLIQIVAAVGVGLVVVGSVVTALGIAFIGAGAAIGGVITIIGVITSAVTMLLTPMGLLTAAVVGGIAYWLLWTEGGKKAAASIVGAFKPMLDTVKQTLGGVYDALGSGDLALAGKIAITGLKLVVAQGLAGLASLIDGVWGDTIKAIGGDLLKGDFTGAWNTALSAMGAAWDAWSAGVVKTFAGVAKAIIGLWEGTVNRISTFLLEQAAEGGVAGSLFSGLLGVDVQAEKARAELQERQRREGRKRELPAMIGRVEAELEAAKADTLFGDGDGRQIKVLENQLAQLRKELEQEQGSMGDFDPLALGRDALNQNSTADAMRGFFDGLADQAQRQAEESADDLGRSTASGAGAFDTLIDTLRTDLANLTAEAARKRSQAAAEQGGGDEGGGPGDGMAAAMAGKVAVSFSAAALGAMGQGGGPQERMARAAEQLRDKQDRLIELNEAMLQEQRNMQLEFTA